MEINYMKTAVAFFFLLLLLKESVLHVSHVHEFQLCQLPSINQAQLIGLERRERAFWFGAPRACAAHVCVSFLFDAHFGTIFFVLPPHA